MEVVKTSQTITEADPRRLMFVLVNQRTGSQRQPTFAEFEARVSDVVFPSDVPEEVKNHLTTAKNLLLYSWYYYPFSDTATLQLSLAVERALKIRLAKPRAMLTELLKDAIKREILKEDGFPRWSAHRRAMQKLHSLEDGSTSLPLLDILVDALPSFRNTLAHGGTFLADSGFLSLQITADIIDQLFKPSCSAP